jgi:hypothetical protein
MEGNHMAMMMSVVVLVVVVVSMIPLLQRVPATQNGEIMQRHPC